MAVTPRPALPQAPKITPVSFSNSDSANTKKTIHTAGANGSKITGVFAASTDTSNRTAQLWLTRSAVSYLIGSTVVTTLAGTDGAQATQNLLSTALQPLPVDNDGQPYLFLESGDTLQVSFTAQITAAKNAYVFAQGADF